MVLAVVLAAIVPWAALDRAWQGRLDGWVINTRDL